MFFCYLWGRQIPFVFFVYIKHTHKTILSFSYKAENIFSLIFIFPLPLNTDQAWKIFSQRNNVSQSCDANEESMVTTYTGWEVDHPSLASGGQTLVWRPAPQAMFIPPQLVWPLSRLGLYFPLLPTKRMRHSFLPRMPGKGYVRIHLLTVCGLGHCKMENVETGKYESKRQTIRRQSSLISLGD